MNERSHLEMVRDWIIIVMGTIVTLHVVFA